MYGEMIPFGNMLCGPLPKEKFETCDSKGLSNCTKIGRSCYQYFKGPLSFYCANFYRDAVNMCRMWPALN
ncbi:UNVERIFIED_CONTAM: hypothetical protein FKN15_004168 [Acipenser sinensis]